IGGARQRLSSGEVRDESSQAKQIIRQTIAELEDVLKLLRS
ncbi:MAG TPA: MerR family transcriptional regulator, partial [Thiopseudomonas sp.]|nr:MerR family transcriptional regulator [Thiopseudomonas sp.]